MSQKIALSLECLTNLNISMLGLNFKYDILFRQLREKIWVTSFLNVEQAFLRFNESDLNNLWWNPPDLNVRSKNFGLIWYQCAQTLPTERPREECDEEYSGKTKKTLLHSCNYCTVARLCPLRSGGTPNLTQNRKLHRWSLPAARKLFLRKHNPASYLL